MSTVNTSKLFWSSRVRSWLFLLDFSYLQQHQIDSPGHQIHVDSVQYKVIGSFMVTLLHASVCIGSWNLLRRLAYLTGISNELSRCKTPCITDDVTIIMSRKDQLPWVEDCIAAYQAVVGAMINQETSVGLQLGIWRGMSISFSIGGKCMGGPIKCLGDWFNTNF